MGSIEVAGIVDVVDVQHDETRWDGVGGLARAIIVKTAGMRRDDGQLTFETSELVGVVAVEEFDLVADGLDKGLLHGKFNLRPEDGGWGSSTDRRLEAYSRNTHKTKIIEN